MKRFHLCGVVVSSVLMVMGCQRNDFTASAPAASLSPAPSPTPTAAVSGSSGVPGATPSPTPTPGNCGLPGASPAESVNLLAGNLYGSLKSNPGNVFFSPFSLLTAMSMAQEGANGSTACQMQTALNLNPLASTRLPEFQAFLATLNAASRPYTLMTSDNLWVQNGFNILPSYLNVCQNDYDAGVTNVDFANNPNGALNTINGAVSQETGGYIPNLLSAANITPGLKLVLTNAVFFKGDWLNQFQASMTYPQTFNLDTGADESVSMMHETINASLGSFNGAASVLALPYKGSSASMYIFLPPPGGTASLESAMTASNLQAWLASNGMAMTAAGGGQVDLALPKFTFSNQYDLTATFQAMMPLPFGSGADFSGIDGNKDLYIQWVVHQAYVGVDETGTTAAAATGVGIGGLVSFAPSPVSFVVDHPFMFLLVDNATGTVLFMGRVSDPLSSS